MQKFYVDTVAIVSGGTGTSATVSMNKGVKQGCPMSPLIFSLFFDRVAEFLLQPSGDVTMDADTFSFAFVQFCILMFADDAVLIARSPENLQKTFKKFLKFC